MEAKAISVFALSDSLSFGERVAAGLNISLSELEERDFVDGEHKIRPLVSVRGRDVFVIQALYSDKHRSVNDKLCRLLFLLNCLRDNSAARVTAVIPYLAYARKDRKTQPRDPVTSRYIAALIEAMGTDGVITLDVHNLAAYQNGFRCRSDHLEATPLFADYFASLLRVREKIAVMSPDAGGIKRARRFGVALAGAMNREISFAFMEKERAKNVLTIGRLVGDVEGCTVVVIDDLIASGSTLLGAAAACRENGAGKVYAAASHGLFVGSADRLFSGDELEQIVVTDTVPPFRLNEELARRKLVVVPATDLFAKAIRRIHEGGSLAELLSC